MPSGNISLLTLTVSSAEALAAGRFVTQAGTYPAAGAAPFGVTRTSAAAAGALVPVDILGTAMAETAGAIARDQPLMVDATGRVLARTGSSAPVGRAMEDASGAGAFIEVLLLPGVGQGSSGR